MRAIDDVVRDLALRGGIHVSRVTPPDAVLEVVARLWPTYDPARLARYGADGDGGYLLPDDLHGIAAVVSPGVADNVSFELDLAQLGIPSWLVDASIDALPRPVPGATFLRRFVGSRTEGDLVSLQDLVAAVPAGDLVVQLDVEGDEYRVLDATPTDVLRRARILVVEFHDLFGLFEPTVGPFMLRVLTRLLDSFGVAHVHANNMDGVLKVARRVIPRALEVTFVRHDAMLRAGGPVRLPHPLDRPCRPDRPDVVPVFLP